MLKWGATGPPSHVSDRKLVCELIGGPHDGLKLEFRWTPPEPHLDIPPEGLPGSGEELAEWFKRNPLRKLLRYVLDWWDGADKAKYRYEAVAGPIKRER